MIRHATARRGTTTPERERMRGTGVSKSTADALKDEFCKLGILKLRDDGRQRYRKLRPLACHLAILPLEQRLEVVDVGQGLAYVLWHVL